METGNKQRDHEESNRNITLDPVVQYWVHTVFKMTEAVRRVLFIRHAKELGFTLKEIQELLQIRTDPSSMCVDVRKQAKTRALTSSSASPILNE